MASVNKVIIVGRVGQEPEVRFLANGDAVANLSVATSESWKDKSTGEKVEKTEWHKIVIYRKLAEIVQQYVKKGDLVYFEGKLETKKWQDKEGVDRYTTQIVAHEMQMLGGKKDGSASGGGSGPAPRPEPSKQPGNTGFEDMSDDIPFVYCDIFAEKAMRRAR